MTARGQGSEEDPGSGHGERASWAIGARNEWDAGIPVVNIGMNRWGEGSASSLDFVGVE